MFSGKKGFFRFFFCFWRKIIDFFIKNDLTFAKDTIQ